MSNQIEPGISSSVQNSSKSQSIAPFEGALIKAFDKLTSQIFIFLLAYVILLIGLAGFGSEMAATLRNLLYIIPVLGVVAYVWLQQRQIIKQASDKGVHVRAGIVKDSAYVAGRRGPISDSPDTVTVGVGLASRGTVIGVDNSSADDTGVDTPQSSDAKYLMDIFQKLNESNRRKLIGSAQGMLNKQENSDD